MPIATEPPNAFDSSIRLVGTARHPRQMLSEQSYGGHTSVHDATTAGGLGLAGAPIEGPTHFSQFDPLAFACWGRRWFETGCVSTHFTTMAIDGDEVTASLVTKGTEPARITATKSDGTEVLSGTASVGGSATTEIDERQAKRRDPGELFIVDQLTIGQRSTGAVRTSVDMDSPNGQLYPFSLRQKLDAITEPSSWYIGANNPWGRPILPFEMVSVLTEKVGSDFAVRGPAVGLFLDLEVRLDHGPVFVGQDYLVEREVVGLGQSRRTESYWVRTNLIDADQRRKVATVTLHSGVFKESYAGYPPERLKG